MCGDHHVGRLGLERRVDDAGVGSGQLVDVLATFLRLRQLLLRAQIGPGRIVELQVAAAGVIEGLDGLAVHLGEVVEIGLHVRVGGVSLVHLRIGKVESSTDNGPACHHVPDRFPCL